MPRPTGRVQSAPLLVLAALAALPAAGCGKTEPPGPDAPPQTVRTASGAEMVLVPGGWFQMGSRESDEVDEPAHDVRVDPFYLDVHEVTQEEYQRLLGANPSRWKDPRNPVEQIRWANAVAFCNARSRLEGLRPAYDEPTGACDFDADGYRLPTEAEWEYAWFKDTRCRSPQPVGGKQPNPWGLYDMYGNVWEWCHDFYDENAYRQGPQENPRGPATGQTRVLRGGCWNSRPDACRSAYRNSENPGYTDVCFGADVHGFVGFRCARPHRPGSPEAGPPPSP